MQKNTFILILALSLTLLIVLPVGAEAQDVWQEAKAEGVQFRAVGNEPGWLVEIREDQRIKFVNNYGDLELKAPVDDLWIGPVGEDKIYYVENDAIQFQVVVMKKDYQDSMSGERLPYQVRVVFPNKSYVGGGKLLVETEE
ncbi:hypothetical protein [Halanaerobium praevalens]|uniref:Uncharacterized protein n=1 Tax=Halanaerobium praevalens (strain ATCC 33744 / DSM 2228 / GSL) TaxID=572479 RepID=E3DRR4_HALPG|nr:hypothetical protein [Halanaerobium praevalens]ADO78128.1 hypothetical protein Hprae_2004 [Halanaerobium praevalens DSM 2228]